MRSPLTVILNWPEGARRAVAVLLLLAMAGIAFVAVGTGASVLMGWHAELRDKREILGRLQSIARMKLPPMPSDAEDGEGLFDDVFLKGESDAVATANLQAKLNGISAERGLQLLSVGTAPEVRIDGVTFAGLRAELTGSIEGVYGTILELERARPPLVIRSARLWLANGNSGAGIDHAPEIVAQIEFHGAVNGGGPGDGGARP